MTSGLLTPFAEAVRPPPKLSVCEFADREIILPTGSGDPGPYRTAKTPYVREVGDCLSIGSPYHTVVVKKSAQTGFTQLAVNWLAYTIVLDPSPFLFVEPTDTDCQRLSRTKIAPAIESCAALRSRVATSRSKRGSNTLLFKEYPGGPLVITSANSATGLRQIPARRMVFDDCDGYPPDVGGEGAPMEIAKARQRAGHFGLRQTLVISTPTIEGESQVDHYYGQSDQRRLFVPCPCCGDFAPIEWNRIIWPEHDPARAFLRCHECQADIPESAKTELLANSEWRATAETKDPGMVGFHLSSLYAPVGWISWGQIAIEFLSAKAGGRETLKPWTNTVLGECWQEEGLTIQAEAVADVAEEYPAEIPADCHLLVAAVDVQDDRLELEVMGAGAEYNGTETWGIEYRVFHGDTLEQPVWDTLQQFLSTTWKHESGHRLGIVATAIDTGHRATKCYAEVKRLGRRRTVYAVKGRGGPNLPIVGLRAKAKRGRHQPVPVFIVGTDAVKDLIYDRLQNPDPGPGYCHFPSGHGYDLEYFKQLTAEKRETRFRHGFPIRVWTLPSGRRNEALDIRGYAIACLEILKVDWPRQRALLERPLQTDSTDRSPRARKRRRKGNWVTEGLE